MKPESFNDYEDRLHRLEKEHRLLKICGLSLLLLIGSVLLSTCGNESSAVVKAEQFLLVDSTGQTRGGLLVGRDGPALELYDSKKTLRATVSLVGDMPNVTLKDSSGIGRVVLAIVPTGPGLILTDESGMPRAQLDVGKEGPRLYVEDKDGASATVGSYYELNSKDGRKLPAASLILSEQTRGVIWRAP